MVSRSVSGDVISDTTVMYGQLLDSKETPQISEHAGKIMSNKGREWPALEENIVT